MIEATIKKVIPRGKALVAFTLSMPGVGSWNGKWTGADRCYARVHKVARKDLDGLVGGYHYNFGDGWRAYVNACEISAGEARKSRRKSVGFAGYDWMIDSILRDRRIIAPSDRQVEAQAATDTAQIVQSEGTVTG